MPSRSPGQTATESEGLYRSATRRGKKRGGERIDRRNESTIPSGGFPAPVTNFSLRGTPRLARSKLTRQTPGQVRISAASRWLSPQESPNQPLRRFSLAPPRITEKLAEHATRSARMIRSPSASMLPRAAAATVPLPRGPGRRRQPLAVD
jgi:hypothetical protein